MTEIVSSTGDKVGRLTLTSDDPDTPSTSISLGGTGVQPDINLDSATLSFSDTRVGGQRETSVTITNDGNADLSVTDITITGSDADAFSVSSRTSFTLTPTESETVSVQFAPDSEGDKAATLAVDSNDPDESTATASLDGEAITPAVDLSKQALQYGTVTIDESKTLTVTITNQPDATASLPVTDLSIVGRDNEAFSVDDASFTLAPGESRDLDVTLTPTTPGDKAASLRILTDDPRASQRNVWLTNTDTVVLVDPEATVNENKTAVDAQVQNAEANSSTSIPLSTPESRDADAGTDELNISVNRDGDFSVNLTSSDTSAVVSSPVLDRADGTQAVKYVQIQSSASDSMIANATSIFRVSKVQLKQSDPNDVVMFRHQNGEWTELQTELIGQTRTHYLYQAVTSGFSSFAIGAEIPQFEVVDTNLETTSIAPGGSVEIEAEIANTGGADGSFTVDLVIDGETVESQSVALAAGGSKQIVFEHTFDDSGTHTVRINSAPVGEIEVREPSVGGGGGGGGAPAPPVTEPSTTVELAAQNTLSIDIQNLEQGQAVTASLPRTTVGQRVNVGFTAVELTTVEDMDTLGLTITQRTTAPSGTPLLNASVDDVRSLSYFNITHTLADSQFSTVVLRFQVRQSVLTNRGQLPENVRLFRFNESTDSWEMFNPSFTFNSSSGFYEFTVTRKHPSVYAVGLQQPEFTVQSANVQQTSIVVDQSSTIRVQVNNRGKGLGRFTAQLTADGTIIDRQTIEIPPGASEEIRFTHVFSQPGTVTIAVNGVTAGTLTVEAKATPKTTIPPQSPTASPTLRSPSTASPTSPQPSPPETPETPPRQERRGLSPPLIGGIIVIVILVALYGYYRRREH